MTNYHRIINAILLISPIVLSAFFNSCSNNVETTIEDMQPVLAKQSAISTSSSSTFLQGADLSYVNELQDNGVKYYKGGTQVDPYQLIKEYGGNLVRIRLWHNPTWTNYSTLADAKRSIGRAKNAGLKVLLDFHYSDTWTDPQQNLVPKAWRNVVKYSSLLADSVYKYTYNTLLHLYNNNLLPDIVQIGNETNNSILVADNSQIYPTNYVRNTKLFNAGLQAVSDFNNTYAQSVKTILHVAMTPSEAMYWLAKHKRYGLRSFDMLGVSYYPQWQEYTPAELGAFASTLKATYGVQLFVAETGHIWTRAWNDNYQNLMSKVCKGYSEVPSPQMQKDYLVEIKNALLNNGGAGFSVWEPFWVSSNNSETGSKWENVTFFDFNNTLLPHCGIEAYGDYNVKVTFEVNMYNYDPSAKAYITGDFTDDGFGNWQIIPMTQAEEGSTIYYFDTYLCRNQTGKFFFLSDSTWNKQETINGWKQDRSYDINTTGDWMKISKNFGEE
ncbi:MAG: glycoside hydrolase family 53 protein [Prevotella sp.]|jgi:arabinogalactan endo-1,4-beta-galactosidase